jgi:FAD synthetase
VKNKVKKVIVFGTFDIFHDGHRNFLEQAKKYGDFLQVVVARDATVLKVKKYASRYSEQERLDVIKKSALADEVVLGSLNDKYAVIRNYKPDIICLGYDQKFFINDLRKRLDEAGLSKTKIVKLKSYNPEIYKSSKLIA